MKCKPSSIRASAIAVAIAVIGLVPAASQAEPMTGEELKELYAAGVTECGAYPEGSKRIPYCEYWRRDGKIFGQSNQGYTGTYTIKADQGIVCANFGREDICGTIEHKSGNIYRVPYVDGSFGEVTIVKGDTENLE